MVNVNTSDTRKPRMVTASRPRVNSNVEPHFLPFEILMSNEEQMPWYFTGMHCDADKKYAPIVVKVTRTHLKTGDYTIRGCEHCFTIERKSVSDIFSTLSGGRDRFMREHERMHAMIAAGGRAFVVIEGDLSAASKAPPSNLDPKSVRRTMLSWMMQYWVPWIWAGDRPMAELIAFDLMNKFWDRLTEGKEQCEIKSVA